MKAYHEIKPESLATTLKDGLVRTSRGNKGDDEAIVQTDRFLDKRRPQHLKDEGVSRSDNLYAYVRIGDKIIDITDGSRVSLSNFIARNKPQVLELTINPERCFLSDLDAYDALKSALEAKEGSACLDELAKNYWGKVIKLSGADISSIRRPEIMITYDISPERITACN